MKQPLLDPKKSYPEVTPYSVAMGILMAIIFSAAAAYLGLKVGQVFEAAIPIAIIAVGVSGATKRKNALGENVIIQSIGACSGVIVAGAIFTLPALYILKDKYPELSVDFFKVFTSSLLGGVLGILMLIPFRKYFVKDKADEYPFPEATATTQVLESGEKGGSGAKTLLVSGLIGGIYDFIAGTFGLWAETISTTMTSWGAAIADKAKLVLKLNTGAAVLGLGYIIGLKYAFIICCGSFLVWLVIIPLINLIWGGQTLDLMGNGITATISELSAQEIFKDYARHIGIGGIAAAGVISIIKQFGIIKSAVALASQEFRKGGKAASNGGATASCVNKTAEEVGKGSNGGATASCASKGGNGIGVETAAETELRTDRDLSMKVIVAGIIITLLVVFLFFQFGVVHNLWHAIIGVVVVGIITFLFTTVAANAIAIVGSNPVSGMTLMTLILASIVMVAAGLKGPSGMTAALIIGGVVCTALSMAGGFITDLKVGANIGTTPRKQETWKFLGTLVSAATVGGVMIVLNKAYGFTGDGALVAPQANAMAAVIQPLMNGGSAPWILYGIGAVIAILLTVFKVPALAFALGMFIPMELNLPLLVGGAIAWLVGSRNKDKAINDARNEKGTLIASGFIAGGALMGVVSAILKFAGVDLWMTQGWWTNPLAVVVYIAIIIWFIFSCLKKEK